jgi:hypothetical protein
MENTKVTKILCLCNACWAFWLYATAKKKLVFFRLRSFLMTKYDVRGHNTRVPNTKCERT